MSVKVPDFKLEDLNVNDPEEIQWVYNYFYPRGSGSLAMMRCICVILEKIADDKGFELTTKKRLVPNK